MKIFISGLPKSGKTTLMKKLIEKVKDHLAIISEEIKEKDERIGFWFCLIEDGKEIMKKELALKKENPNFGKYFVFIENIEEIVKEARKRMDKKAIFIDEIGKMEMMSKEFRKFIEELIKKRKIVATLHRSYVKEFRKYGKVYWLTRKNFDEIYNKILHSINNIDA
jgi:nucleoside-triphosphatase